MMAQPSEHAAETPFSVVGSQFISPHPLELIIEKYPCTSLVITDINHENLFKVKPCDTSFHRQCLLLDANDVPILMLREKNLSTHKQWVAFRGESKSDSDIIFKTKTKRLIQFNPCTSVSLADNEDCDLKIEGSWKKGNCTIGESSTILAKMNYPQTLLNAEDKFMVMIQPNMDYAFVVALFAIVDALENPYGSQVFVWAQLASEVIVAALL